MGKIPPKIFHAITIEPSRGRCTYLNSANTTMDATLDRRPIESVRSPATTKGEQLHHPRGTKGDERHDAIRTRGAAHGNSRTFHQCTSYNEGTKPYRKTVVKIDETKALTANTDQYTKHRPSNHSKFTQKSNSTHRTSFGSRTHTSYSQMVQTPTPPTAYVHQSTLHPICANRGGFVPQQFSITGSY